MSEQEITPDVVRAKKFILEDENSSKTRALLRSYEDGVELLLCDEDGETRVRLGANKDSMGLSGDIIRISAYPGPPYLFRRR